VCSGLGIEPGTSRARGRIAAFYDMPLANCSAEDDKDLEYAMVFAEK